MKLKFFNEEVIGETSRKSISFYFNHIMIDICFINEAVSVWKKSGGKICEVPVTALHNRSLDDIDCSYKLTKDIQEIIDNNSDIILKKLISLYKNELDYARFQYDNCVDLYSKELMLL